MSNSTDPIDPLVDSFGRIHRNLRLSVTDRCNIRCFYCMPNENIKFLPQRDLLSFEEMTKVVEALAPMGIDRIRLTGGEPLVRKQLWKLVEMLRSIGGIRDIALTTNAVLLQNQAQQLRDAGLDRINISLDTIDQKKFHEITRRDDLSKVLTGIRAAKESGFEQIRINAVSIAGVTETEIVDLANFCRDQQLELRFIEFMPLDADSNWESGSVLSGAQVRKIIEQYVCKLSPASRDYAAQPAVDYVYQDGSGQVGFIDPVSKPFCSACDRVRITAEGKIRNCLFSTKEWDVRQVVRNNGSATEIRSVVRGCVAAKKKAHGIDSDNFVRPDKAMYQIGG